MILGEDFELIEKKLKFECRKNSTNIKSQYYPMVKAGIVLKIILKDLDLKKLFLDAKDYSRNYYDNFLSLSHLYLDKLKRDLDFEVDLQELFKDFKTFNLDINYNPVLPKKA